jgi:hypothetical protein
MRNKSRLDIQKPGQANAEKLEIEGMCGAGTQVERPPSRRLGTRTLPTRRHPMGRLGRPYRGHREETYFLARPRAPRGQASAE